GRAQERDAAAGDDALLNGRARGVQRIVDAVLALLDLDFGRAADADDGDAARQLGEALLELLAVVVGGGVLDLLAQLRHAPGYRVLLAGAVDDGGGLLLHPHLPGAAELLDHHVLELDAEILADDLAAGEDGDVLQHGLAPIAEARRLDGG